MRIEDNICEAIELIVERAIAKANFDITIQATIIQKISQQTYSCKYQDSIIKCHAYNGLQYNNGDHVYVLIPRSGALGDRIILSKSTIDV